MSLQEDSIFLLNTVEASCKFPLAIAQIIESYTKKCECYVCGTKKYYFTKSCRFLNQIGDIKDTYIYCDSCCINCSGVNYIHHNNCLSAPLVNFWKMNPYPRVSELTRLYSRQSLTNIQH